MVLETSSAEGTITEEVLSVLAGVCLFGQTFFSGIASQLS